MKFKIYKIVCFFVGCHKKVECQCESCLTKFSGFPVDPAEVFDNEFGKLRSLGFFSEKDYQMAKHYFCFRYFSEGILLYHKPQVPFSKSQRFSGNIKGVFLFLASLYHTNN